MKINQSLRTSDGIWQWDTAHKLTKPLVLVFGDRFALENTAVYDEIRQMYPDGELVFGSTSGEIMGANVLEETITVTAIEFEKVSYRIVSKNLEDYTSVEEMGKAIAQTYENEGLRHLFVVSDGSFVNGSGLIEGLEAGENFRSSITGGLCGDGARFTKTLASYNQRPKQGEVVTIGFYGDTLEVSYANYGGWTPFGPERTITKAIGNVLYEIDGKPALDLYKTYLGEKAKELPQAALLYPLSVQESEDEQPLVRTILNIDEAENSMILAGDMPMNAKVQLMMSTMDDIANGAATAAQQAMEGRKVAPELALLVSCVGRKLVLAGRVEEEIEEVMDVVGESAKITGFYSYGEMAPFSDSKACQLHNQTMTLTLMSE